MIELSEIQRDYITEILNISMGSAAAVLSEMVSEEVGLSVPEFDFLPGRRAAKEFELNNEGKMSGVIQGISGALTGEALLMFPEEKTLSIVRILLGDAMPVANLTEMEQEALCEIGNIILNSVIGSVANMLKKEIKSSLPHFVCGTANEIFQCDAERKDDLIMFLKVDFSLESQSINGYVTLMLNIALMQDFAALLDEMLDAI